MELYTVKNTVDIYIRLPPMISVTSIEVDLIVAAKLVTALRGPSGGREESPSQLMTALSGMSSILLPINRVGLVNKSRLLVP